jgi:hypothetical protein
MAEKSEISLTFESILSAQAECNDGNSFEHSGLAILITGVVYGVFIGLWIGFFIGYLI